MPGVIAAIRTFGDRINFHPHLHYLVTEGGVDEEGVFHKIPRIDDLRLSEIFAREVLAMLVRKELLNSEWADRILSWPHTIWRRHPQRPGVFRRDYEDLVKGRAFGSPLARGLKPRSSTAEIPPGFVVLIFGGKFSKQFVQYHGIGEFARRPLLRTGVFFFQIMTAVSALAISLPA